MAVESNSFGPPWTILKLLDWSRNFFSEKGIGTPRLDAEILLAHTLGIERVQLYAQFDRPLEKSELETYRGFVKRRVLGEPVAHLVGERGFWTFDLVVNADVLVPRPETETVVETALSLHDSPKRVIDVGTGSGAIAIALALEWPDAEVVAIDISSDALSVANENFRKLAPDIVSLESDLFATVDGNFDIIASNPPYVADSDGEMAENVRKFEPAVALFSGPSGLEVYERLIPAAFDRLNADGWLVLEIGHRQSESVSALLRAAQYEDVETRKDLAGKDRVVIGRKA